MKGYGPATFGEINAEFYDLEQAPNAETLRAVETLAELAAGGRVLELAIGTGRIAVPLAERGLDVSGMDASPEMIAKLRAKPGGADIPVTIADMADVGVDGPFDLIFLVFNTLFNLTSQADQVRCFKNSAARLSRRGRFVIEAFVPEVARYADGQRLRTVHIDVNRVVVEASIHDPVTQVIRYQYITTTPEGVRLEPLPLRYAWPAEIDLMARLAGLELRERWSDWDRSPFTAASASHVSVYGWDNRM
jgi:SAM-dependent methyltransferase